MHWFGNMKSKNSHCHSLNQATLSELLSKHDFAVMIMWIRLQNNNEAIERNNCLFTLVCKVCSILIHQKSISELSKPSDRLWWIQESKTSSLTAFASLPVKPCPRPLLPVSAIFQRCFPRLLWRTTNTCSIYWSAAHPKITMASDRSWSKFKNRREKKSSTTKLARMLFPSILPRCWTCWLSFPFPP